MCAALSKLPTSQKDNIIFSDSDQQWNEYLKDAGEEAGGAEQDDGCHLHAGVRAGLVEEDDKGEASNGNGDETTKEDEKSPSASSLWSIPEILAWR